MRLAAALALLSLLGCYNAPAYGGASTGGATSTSSASASTGHGSSSVASSSSSSSSSSSTTGGRQGQSCGGALEWCCPFTDDRADQCYCVPNGCPTPCDARSLEGLYCDHYPDGDGCSCLIGDTGGTYGTYGGPGGTTSLSSSGSGSTASSTTGTGSTGSTGDTVHSETSTCSIFQGPDSNVGATGMTGTSGAVGTTGGAATLHCAWTAVNFTGLACEPGSRVDCTGAECDCYDPQGHPNGSFADGVPGDCVANQQRCPR